MGLGLIKGESSVWIKEEVTEGTYVAPASANDAVEVLEDGMEFSLNRETIERNTLSATIETEAPRVGLKTVSATIPVEFKSNTTEGNAPREDLLYKSLMGGKRQLASPVTSKAAGHTSTVIQIEDADIASFVVDGVYLFKISTGYEVRPVTTIVTTPGAATITVAIPFMAGAPSGAIVIAKMTQYFHQEGAPTLSVTEYDGGEIENQMTGMRAISASLDNWSTAQVASFSFSLEGLNLIKNVAAPAFTPSFGNDALPPVLLDACLFINQDEVQYNELSLSIENTKADIPSACDPNGKVGTRYTQFQASGSVNPYMEDDDTDRFDKFNNNESVSIFFFAKNPGAVSGQDINWVACWMPNVKITEIPGADVDGVLTDAISFQAFRKNGGDTIFLSFI